MAYVNHKSLSLANNLASKLAQRLAPSALGSLGVTQGFDSSGYPTITVGLNVAGDAGCVIRIMPQSWPLATDVFGNAANVYTPDVLQVAWEAEAAAQASWINSVAVRAAILFEAALMGTQVQQFHSSNGTAPSTSAMTGTPDSVFDPNLQYPMVGNS